MRLRSGWVGSESVSWPRLKSVVCNDTKKHKKEQGLGLWSGWARFMFVSWDSDFFI